MWFTIVLDFIQALPTLFSIFNTVRNDVNNEDVPPVAVPIVPATAAPDGMITTKSVLTQIHQNYKDSPKAP